MPAESEHLEKQGDKKMKSSTQDKIEGTLKQATGNVKKNLGKEAQEPQLEKEGEVEKTTGKVQRKVGDIKKVFGK